MLGALVWIISTSMDTEIVEKLTKRTKCLAVMFVSLQLVKMLEIAQQMLGCDSHSRPAKTTKNN